jgi:hypothetical protein
MVPDGEEDELRRLREENGRLKALLIQHGIAWDEPSIPEPVPAPTDSTPTETHFTTDDKIALFRRLFRGREDVYPQRWESAKGKSGYSTACGNEWKPGVCHKPKIKCGDCSQRLMLPATDRVIYNHLAGNQTIGVYPLLADDTCYLLAADFDDAGLAGGRKGFSPILQGAWHPGGAGDFPFRQRRSRVDLFCRAGSGPRGPTAWGRTDQPHLSAYTAIVTNQLRQIVSQPGHHSQRWFRQPDRAAPAKAAERIRPQCVCR